MRTFTEKLVTWSMLNPFMPAFKAVLPISVTTPLNVSPR